MGKEKPSEFFLDGDSSSSLGNVDYMREAKTIRRTFPGTVDSPGTKEQIMTVAAETESLDKRSDGLGDDRRDPEAGEEDLRRAGEHPGDEQPVARHRHHGC